jgi:hypothetical protein
MSRFFCALIALLLIAAPVAHARELGIDLKTLPKLKKNELLPEKEFEAQTKKIVENDPYSEPKISYTLRVPKNWTDNLQKPPVAAASGKSMLSARVLGIVGRYVGSPVNLVRSYITIEAQTLAYEISAQNWFVNFILSNGFSLTALTEKNSSEVEALYVQVLGDQTFVVRTRVVLNGPNLMVIRYYLPQENYETEYTQQEQVMRSFRLLLPVNEKIERQAQYGFLDQSYFNYPESWALKEKNILSVERMSAVLFQAKQENEGKKRRIILEGHIKINVISRLLKTTMQQEIETFRANLKIPNYTIGKLIEQIKYDYDPTIKSGKAQVYTLAPSDPVNMQEYEFLVTIMEGEDYYYITSMITPSRQEDFYTWAQNMEAAKIINESMRRHNVSLEYDPNDPYFDYLKQ